MKRYIVIFLLIILNLITLYEYNILDEALEAYRIKNILYKEREAKIKEIINSWNKVHKYNVNLSIFIHLINEAWNGVFYEDNINKYIYIDYARGK